MQVIARDARLLRGDNGANQYYTTSSITLGGGVVIDPAATYRVTVNSFLADGGVAGGTPAFPEG